MALTWSSISFLRGFGLIDSNCYTYPMWIKENRKDEISYHGGHFCFNVKKIHSRIHLSQHCICCHWFVQIGLPILGKCWAYIWHLAKRMTWVLRFISYSFFFLVRDKRLEDSIIQALQEGKKKAYIHILHKLCKKEKKSIYTHTSNLVVPVSTTLYHNKTWSRGILWAIKFY